MNIGGTLSDNEVMSSGVPQVSILGPVLFLLFSNDLPLSWKNKNGLFADDATVYSTALTMTDVQVQLYHDVSNTSTWTKDHGMAAHLQKTTYIIIYTFRCVWMVGSWNKLKRNVSWDWTSTPPYLGHPR